MPIVIRGKELQRERDPLCLLQRFGLRSVNHEIPNYRWDHCGEYRSAKADCSQN